jgi:glutamyl-tRNA synthetase
LIYRLKSRKLNILGMPSKMIKTRFAPSPTGDPHIGNIRSALFSYLFAKANQGEFLLRIEDTDRERHNPESVGTIKEALEWLEIIPENSDNPMIQSERLEIYNEAAKRLVEQGDAYVCNCSKERLAQVRAERQAQKLPPMYDKHCRDMALPFEDGCVIRMKINENEKIAFDDLVRGHVEFDSDTIDDQVILKSDGFPTYHLAHVVDDNEMQITHVIRAEEWLPSTPKHILLNKMLGYKTPLYAHLPVILSPNGGKLSKRDGAVGIMEYKKMGYLPEAVVNFMLFLGWNPKTNDEILIDPVDFHHGNAAIAFSGEFKFENVNKAPAVFDIKKLNHFNEIYLKQTLNDPDVRADYKSTILREFSVASLSSGELEILGRGGFITLLEMADYIKKLRTEPEYDNAMLIFKKSDLAKTTKGLGAALAMLGRIKNWEESDLQVSLEKAVSDQGLNNGDVFWPVRVALSGEEKSPSPVELLLALGQTESLKRIQKAIGLL